jgi:hypothetical protein
MLRIVQVLPVRCSASRLLFVLPTAMQEEGDVQDTALNCQLVAPCGGGVVCSSQLAAAGWAIISSTGVARATASTRRLIAIVKLPVGSVRQAEADAARFGGKDRRKGGPNVRAACCHQRLKRG